MALTGEKLVDEVQALVGRTSNQVLCDDTRVTRWLNEAQRKIAEQCPGLHCLSFKNVLSLDTTQSLRYSIADITVGDTSTEEKVCHIFDIYYLDGQESKRLTFTHIDVFDEEWPDPTHADIAVDKPNRWTRRGSNIEIFPLSACSYCDKDLRIEGGYYPGNLATNDVSASDISGADNGLILYAVWQAWEAIGNTTEAIKARKRWSNPDPLPGEDEGWLEKFQDKNDILHEWDGDLYSDLIE